ncbi:MAG: NAD(P)/FAD-dependent oxidoreductase [Bacilli bacterium]
MYDIIIIGGGVVGSLIARKLSSYDTNVLVLEKNNDVGNGVSNANSAIIHSGYDPKPGSLKAKYNVIGNAMYDKLAEELDVDFQRIGSLTLALKNDDLSMLDELKARADKNEVPASILNREELEKIEPSIQDDVVAALFAPTAGVIDPFNLVAHAMENAVDNGVSLKLNEPVINITKQGDKIAVTTSKGTYLGKVVINTAGLYSTTIAKLVDKDFQFDIIPRKGEYFVLDNNISLVNHVCFPLPNNLGKGILVSKTTSNNFIIGPNNVPAKGLDDFSTNDYSLKEIKEKAGERIKNIPFNSTIRVFAGLRPTIKYPDFYIAFSPTLPNFLNLIGIDSPGLVSAPAIAEDVVENMINGKIVLKKKENYNPYVRKYVRVKQLSYIEKEKLIKENPNFGRIVCLCETVSLGEIEDVLSRSIPVTTIKGVKKRLRAGFGRCQGSFCQPLIAELLAKKYNLELSDIKYDNEDSVILFGLAK